MLFSGLRFPIGMLTSDRPSWRRMISSILLVLITALSYVLLMGTPSALASLNDDKFDGNIFALYAGNGSLVPPRVTLKDSFKRGKPALLLFYVDDSSDCKKYSSTFSQLQAFYGKAADFMPINVDAIPSKTNYTTTEPGYYYKGLVPQTVLIDQNTKIVLNETGNISFEQVDDAFRQVFNLLPRSESAELKRRPVNEINIELTQ